MARIGRNMYRKVLIKSVDTKFCQFCYTNCTITRTFGLLYVQGDYSGPYMVQRMQGVSQTHRAFHNVLRDYKHLKQENQRTYLNGIVHSHNKTGKVFFFYK